MAAFLHSLNHGTRSLEIAYLLVQVAMLIALRREGAAYEKYLKLSPKGQYSGDVRSILKTLK